MGDTVNQMLLQEAQTQVASLRTDLHVARRVAEERKQALEGLVRANEGLKQQLAEANAHIGTLEGSAKELLAAQQQISALQSQLAAVQKDLDLSIRARKILEGELASERNQRAAVEQSKAALQAERAQLLKSKDDLAAALRVAQRKAEEAEEEQLRAEDEAAALKNELAALQGAMSGGLDGGLSTPLDYLASQRHSRHTSELPAAAAQPAAAAADAAQLQQLRSQVDEERSKAGLLIISLQEAKAENASLQHQVDTLSHSLTHSHTRITALEQQLHTAQQQAATAALAATHQQPHSQQHSQPTDAHHSNGPSGAGNGPVTHMSAGGSHSHGGQQGHVGSSDGGSVVVHGRPRENGYGHTRHGSQSSVPEDAWEQISQLQAQVSKLKASRDKLLEQIDRQWEEMDRLGIENRTLSDDVERLQYMAAGWEAQAQSGLAAEDRLKDMLEEAAAWSGGSGGDRATVESALLAERSRVAELQLQVRALAAELLRAHGASLSFGKAVLPTLSGIELRLNRLVEAGKQSGIHHGSQPHGQQALLTSS